MANMGQSLSKIYVHITFSTKNRENLIDKNIENTLYQYIGGICKSLECTPLQVGGYKNHIHILCLLSKKMTTIKLLEQVKKQSSKWVKKQGTKYVNFYWQSGYGIFSVNPTQVSTVIEYIDNQKQHHTKMTFKEELLLLLKKYGSDYDEKYLWD